MLDLTMFSVVRMFKGRRMTLAIGTTEDGVIEVWDIGDDSLLMQLDYAEIDDFSWNMRAAKSAYGGDNDH